MRIRFLGTHNAESRDTRLSCLLIDGVIAVDAGSLCSELTFEEQAGITAILLSHGHYDHIRSVPAFAFNNTHRTTDVYAAAGTLEILNTHLADGLIYPSFTSASSFIGHPVLKLHAVAEFETVSVSGYRVTSVPVSHPIQAFGFQIVSPEGKSVFYTGDTGPGLTPVWQHVSPDLIITDLTFPNCEVQVALASGHLCPEMLAAELVEFQRVKGYAPRVVATHVSPRYAAEIRGELVQVAAETGAAISIASDGEELIL